MRKRSFGLIMALTMTVCLLTSLIPADTVLAGKAYEFEVGMEAGYHDELLAGFSAPFHFTIKNNNAENFEGKFQMIVPSYNNKNILYEEDINLVPNGEKSLDFVVGIPDHIPQVMIRITDKKGRVLTDTYKSVNVCQDKNLVRVGILSDDYTALAYMDRQPFISNSEVTTAIYQLELDTFPTNYNALDMLDVIVISDFSTDILSDEQIDALDMWINNGGFLIVGTGSTASKTLSGLNGRVFEAQISGKKSISSCLGLDVFDYERIIKITADEGFYFMDDTASFYAYTPYMDDYKNYVDNDNDGICEKGPYTIGAEFDEDLGCYVTNYGVVVSPDYAFLFEDDAYYTDPITEEIHYKYYDERFGSLPDDDDYFFSSYFYTSIISDSEARDNYCYRAYCDLYGYDPKWFVYEVMEIKDDQAVQDTFDKYWGTDYAEFVDYYLYDLDHYTNYGEDLRTDISSLKFDNDQYSPITCDMVDLSLEGEIPAMRINGMDNDNKQSFFPLVEIVPHGEGYIGLCSVDFTKNPIPRSNYSGEFFRNIIENTIGLSIYKEVNTYNNAYRYGSYGYDESDMMESIASAPRPAIAVYLGIIGIYILAMFVIYFIFRKMKKTFNLWKVYPIMAISATLVIYAFSFTTKTTRLTANTLSIYMPNGVTTREIDYSAIIIPKSKEYSINFADNTTVDKGFISDGYYGYFNQSNIDFNQYVLKYKNTADGEEVSVFNKVALQYQSIKTESVCDAKGKLDVKLGTPHVGNSGENADNIYITNNYSVEMQDIFVRYTDNIYDQTVYIDSIKPGETIRVSDGKICRYTYDASDMYYSVKMPGLRFVGFMLGDLCKPYREANSRITAIDYLFSINRNQVTDGIVISAFPKAKMGNDVFSNKKMNVNRTEVIYEKFDFDDLDVQ